MCILKKLEFLHRRLTRRLHGLLSRMSISIHFLALHFSSFFQYIFCQTPRQAFVICQWSERKPCSQVAHCLGGRQTDKQSAPEQCAKRPSLGAGRGCQGKEVLTRSEPSGHGAVWRNFREGLQRTAKRKKKKQQACRKVSMWLQILGWPKHLFGFHKMLWEKPEQTFWPIQYLKMYFNFSFFFFFPPVRVFIETRGLSLVAVHTGFSSRGSRAPERRDSVVGQRQHSCPSACEILVPQPGIEPACSALFPWRRKRQPTLVFLPGKSHGQRVWQATVLGVTKSWMRLTD